VGGRWWIGFQQLQWVCAGLSWIVQQIVDLCHW
jgi:hypothetical protein